MKYLHDEKYLCKKLGVKEGGGHLFEGSGFSEAYDTWQKLADNLSSDAF